MQLEGYFDFISERDIRLKGHRIGIDNVLDYYLEGYTPEEIGANFPDLSLEQIYATITYYLHNRSQVDSYLSNLAKYREKRYQKSITHPSPLLQRLRKLKSAKFQQQVTVL